MLLRRIAEVLAWLLYLIGGDQIGVRGYIALELVMLERVVPELLVLGRVVLARCGHARASFGVSCSVPNNFSNNAR
jgi:hypothetical protein